MRNVKIHVESASARADLMNKVFGLKRVSMTILNCKNERNSHSKAAAKKVVRGDLVSKVGRAVHGRVG